MRPLCYYLIARKPKVLAATNHYNKIIGRYSLFTPCKAAHQTNENNNYTNSNA